MFYSIIEFCSVTVTCFGVENIAILFKLLKLISKNKEITSFLYTDFKRVIW